MIGSEPAVVAKRAYTILLVDDDPEVLKVISRFLRRVGHQVFACSGFEEAQVHLVNGINPDLLITDIVLRASTGKRVAAAVKQLSPSTRVIFISGYGNVSVGGPVLQKPFAPHELTSLVDEVMSAEAEDEVHDESVAIARKKLH